MKFRRENAVGFIHEEYVHNNIYIET